MKKLTLLIACLLVVTCTSSKDVVLSLTNPQGIAVAFTGYYYDTETSDTTILDGSTPREYMFTISKNDVIEGSVHKDGPDVIDTLQFEIFVDEETLMVQKVTIPSNDINFTITGN
ncbi:MAG: hypothetical protein JSW02_08945 [candidate division WOR-3 bacterium]|nr:MAG: hypothetical protein JSW02_08945 [candidate division WOR-3 bacterium]